MMASCSSPRVTWWTLWWQMTGFSTLVAAVTAAGLVDTVKNAEAFTIFAPTNDAFAKIPEATLNGLLADKEALTKVLLRHVAPGAVFAKGVTEDLLEVRLLTD